MSAPFDATANIVKNSHCDTTDPIIDCIQRTQFLFKNLLTVKTYADYTPAHIHKFTSGPFKEETPQLPYCSNYPLHTLQIKL